MSLAYYNGAGKAEVVVYERVTPDGLAHSVRRKDGSKMEVHDSFLHIKNQPDLSNIPSTPLDYCKEVGKGISREEAQALAQPRILTPIQQELMA